METQQLPAIELLIPIDESAVAASSTLTSNGSVVTDGKIVTIGTRSYMYKTTLTGAVDQVAIGANATASMANLVALINSGRAAVAATGVLTGSVGKPAAAGNVVVGAKTYTYVSALTEAFATATITADDQPAVGDQVVVGDVTYEFVASLSITNRHGQTNPLQIPNRIFIGADYDTSLGNLVAAINGAAGEGTKYSYGTVVNPKVTAGAVGSHASVMTAKSVGLVGNAIAKSENSAHLDWDGVGAVFTGGVASVANEISLVGADYGVVMQNLIAAINGAAGAGTAYSRATVASTEVTAFLTSAYVMTVTAIAAGIAGNSLTKTKTATNVAWDATATLTGGVSASSVNADVTAGAGTLTSLMTAKTAGFAGNSIATTKDETTVSWTGATLTGGGCTVGTSDPIGVGGKIGVIISAAPNFTGAPTYTVQIVDSSGDQLYVSGALNENAVTRTVVEQTVDPTDKIVITTSTVVESTLPVKINLR